MTGSTGSSGVLPVEIIDGHADLAAEALNGAAFQAAAAARFLARGDYTAGLAAYDRMACLVREYAAHSIRVVRGAGGAA